MKEVLVMIPGTLCDRSLFDHQIKALKELARCMVADHSSSDRLETLAQNILNSIEGDFSVMGLSFGGIIAFEMWRQAPRRLRRMILLNTTHKQPSEKTKALQQRLVEMACGGQFREITSEILKDAMLHPEHAADLSLRQGILQMALNTGRDKFINQVKSQLGRPDSTPDLPHIQCPVLIITGREDKICTPELHAEMAAMIPNSTLEIVEHCGHLSTMEQPEKVNERIIKWWQDYS